MLKKITSVGLSLVIVLSMLFTMSTTASAGVFTGTVTGIMQDTSNPDNGEVEWCFDYDKLSGTATLTLSGDGYMPNDYESSWLPTQMKVQCYVTKLVINNGVKSIMNDAFSYETYLTSVSLPSSIEIIGTGAFSFSGVEQINIPEKVSQLSGEMFCGSAIEKFTVDSDNLYFTTKNGDIYSKDMKTFVVAAPGKFKKNGGAGFKIPTSVTTIAPSAFYLSDIEQINIPGNVKEIKQMAFAGSSLKSVQIDCGLQSIYDSAFLSCYDLYSVAIPSTVTYLGYYSFGHTSKFDSEGFASVLDDMGISHATITEYNAEDYISKMDLDGDGKTDYDISEFYYFAPDSSFKIYAPTDSTGHNFAQRFGMRFIATECDFTRLTSAKLTDSGICLKWNPSLNATGYKIMRKDIFDDWKLISTISDGTVTTYTDKKPYDDIINEYTVIAFNASGDAIYDDIGLSCSNVKAPKVTGITVRNKSIKIKWSVGDIADSYVIYRKVNGSGAWKMAGTTSGDDNSFSDSNVVAGNEYKYTVAAISGGNRSTYGNYVKSALYLGSTTISASNTSKGIKVQWNHKGVVDSFNLYRKKGNGSWSLIKTLDGDKKSYTDKTTKNSSKYTYRLEPVYNSKKSENKTITCTYIAIQAPLKVKTSNTISGVKITWNKCVGAKGYYIYRKLAGNDTKKRIEIINKSDICSFTDKNVKSGKTYTYYVVAYNGEYKSDYLTNGVKEVFLSTPKKNGIKSTGKGVRVQYTKSTGAQGYYIYRKQGSGKWSKIATVVGADKLSYLDKTAKKGTTYTYTVRAYKGNFKSSFYSKGQQIKDKY